MIYDNVNDATTGLLRRLLTHGDVVTVRGMETCELLNCSFTVINPAQRCMLLRERNSNIFAQIAETLWMLAGRDDLDWLERYIPQCKRWSDDGSTWRDAYGPRLRNWNMCRENDDGSWGVDQLSKIVQKLCDDPQTRQAVITLWDPANDWVENSKAYPCNNWLHFIIRDGKLHMNVAVRSNDVIYGFSHADFFGWSVLQQFVAHWVGAQIGTIHWNATSFHVYDKHYHKARQIIDANDVLDVYPEVVPFATDFDMFDIRLRDIFIDERAARYHYGNSHKIFMYDEFQSNDDILTVMDYLLRIYNFHLNNPTDRTVLTFIDVLPECDMKIAAKSFLETKFANSHSFAQVLT